MEIFQVAEMRTVGSISGKVYAGYFHAGGNWCFIITVAMLCIIAQAAASGGDYFLARWVDFEEIHVSLKQIEYFLAVCKTSLTFTWET